MRRSFCATRPSQLFGLSFPTPSNDPLAGTVDGSVPILFILQVVVGLPAALWFYKCLMLVAFQRKIIYLPSVPPGTRNESLEDGERTTARDSSLVGMDWTEIELVSSTPTRVLRLPTSLRGIELSWSKPETVSKPKIVVIYLQGNAGTPLLRIPLFRQLLRPDLHRSTSARSAPGSLSLENLTILAMAPRSFWLSTRSTPTEASVLADYASVWRHAYKRHGASAKYVLYGHSLGGAAASILALDEQQRAPSNPRISGLILENPLPSIPYMVKALYPQKWLPYHYLGFAAFDRWDAIGRLAQLARDPQLKPKCEIVPTLWIRSGRDEIIPTGPDDGVKTMFGYRRTAIERNGVSGNEKAKWVDIPSSLHDTAFMERKWRDEIRSFLSELEAKGTCD
ncbi:alpha/beta hydrolase [Sporobolomyces koalae]|uniref:alpha/beta hydrolase n=1 Tax=Sporobolomyces koalae TaxID=500713 RepID=UPI003170683F